MSCVFTMLGRSDVEGYRAECDARDRASFCFRRTESRLQRLHEEEDKQRQFEVDEESRKMEDLARDDVKVYVKSCQNRRRLSLAFRAKEKCRHAQWRRKQSRKEIEKRSKDTMYHSIDQKYIQLAKEKERAKNALDAMYHLSKGCTFAQNPFAFLLE